MRRSKFVYRTPEPGETLCPMDDGRRAMSDNSQFSSVSGTHRTALVAQTCMSWRDSGDSTVKPNADDAHHGRLAD
ncbi:hypothetical protein MPTK1_5g08110 [Marchantia polymorpha subsp. ruderalis]|uniref:Uncharacterized protein n=2 Tax=Marchantia polymorpha TaxID=3197 RepID=A0AAF6BG46_MARPO|nr:hypothetical protein MARPO_0086s0015 [Marchantia polymorpha]BBN10980.1 hypothetical protein Mp_5g08110 [Marchantia polymorpha subsp. ruderalis]PTQ33679.1 hypothetical protein MARPO_0086s0015 [Marchantia polymorpha]PTQ33680.1 hypothetical protein MARPO_0086s0015 [Marchantia polymorpha]BBN10981.1 hypothetical protein Mp_5g08110 [Marchantia polymorpha subsp. ruderalis]|eukprot:PTQ33678.1 hypothetical protein MARPO_0086s0015 [Marchantia polymorpha]